jgi:hypothetical protein
MILRVQTGSPNPNDGFDIASRFSDPSFRKSQTPAFTPPPVRISYIDAGQYLPILPPLREHLPRLTLTPQQSNAGGRQLNRQSWGPLNFAGGDGRVATAEGAG